MELVSAALWGGIEFVVIQFFFLKSSFFKKYIENAENGIDKKKLNIYKGICILAAIICGGRTAVLVQSEFDCIKMLLVYISFSLAMLTDFCSYIIPNVLCIGLLIGRIILFIPEFVFRKEIFGQLVKESLFGGCICLIILLIISVFTKGGFGMGDVKLLASEGFVIGLYGVINTLLYGLVSCAVCSLFLLATGKKKVKDKLPFAPFIYVGLMVCIALGGF